MSESSKNDQKTYNQLYYETHKEKWNTYHICDECGGKYNLNNKYYHFRSKKHKNAVILKEKEREITELKEQLEQNNIPIKI